MTDGAALTPYPLPEARDARLRQLAEAASGEVQTIGTSVSGREILAARIPSLNGAPLDHMLVSANIHGVELIASWVALAFMERLLTDALRELRENTDFWIVPSINPDGYARTFARGGQGELRELRANERGVDLNRNFEKPRDEDLKWLSFSGSDDPDNAFYRGKMPFSEPETAALRDLFERVSFTGAANLHSFMGSLIPARTVTKEDFEGYRTLARAFTAAQPGSKYRRLASRRFDVFTGEQEDFQHHFHGTWATCVEVFPVAASFRQHLRAPTLFWRFNPRDPDRWADNDVPGLAAYFRAVKTMPAPTGRVTRADTG